MAILSKESDSKIKSILIVGGGTAGWITACMIKKSLGDQIKVRLIESKNIGTVAVGEATVPTLRVVLKSIGIDEKEFLKKCNGTFKLGVQFVNWREHEKTAQDHFINPFGPMPKTNGYKMAEYWLRQKDKGWERPLDYSCSIIPTLCQNKKAPKFLDSPNYLGAVDYAYHVDAKLLANFLQKIARQAGVEYLESDVTKVELKPGGEIDHVKTADLGDLSADLFVDCTGFSGLLINKALGEPFIPFSDVLLCDQAISINLPRGEADKSIPPFTQAIAQESGWIWKIPLQTRWGTGYVFSSQHLSAEDADLALRNFLGDSAKDYDSSVIPMRIGQNRRAWVKNCLSVGLSGGFVEPLESSGIGFIYTCIFKAIDILKQSEGLEKKISKFNHYIQENYDNVRDYLILHYVLSNRRDTPFWRDASEGIKYPEALKTILSECKEHFPDDSRRNRLVHFYDYKLIYLLGSYGYLPEACREGVAKMPEEKVLKKLKNFQIKAQEISNHLTDHLEFLKNQQNGVLGP